jgi:hypothetical protein
MTLTFKHRPGKRGSITDVLVTLVVIGFVTALSFLISFKFYNAFYDAAAPQLNASNYSVSALDKMHGTETTFDYLFMAIMVGMILVGYILAFMTRENPVFIFINILLIIVMVVIGGAMSYAYNEIESDTELAATAANFPVAHFFMSNLAIIMTVAILGMIVVMFTMGATDSAY